MSHDCDIAVRLHVIHQAHKRSPAVPSAGSMSSEKRAGDPRLHHAVTLLRSRQRRDSSGTFLIQGVRDVVHAFQNRFPFERIYTSRILLKSAAARAVLRQLRALGVPVHQMAPEPFRQLSNGQRASGIAAIVHQQVNPLNAIQPEECDCWLVLSTIRSSGNLGCLIRSSVAFGSAGIILIGRHIDPWDPTVVRASMGGLFGMPMIRTDWHELTWWRHRHRLPSVGATAEAAVSCSEFPFRRPMLLLLGDERNGLDERQRATADHLVRIPMAAEVDSLNLSVAGGILLYEIQRRWQSTIEQCGPPD